MIGDLERIAVEMIELPLTAVILTWVAFEVGRWAQRRCRGSALMNPVLIAAALIIAVLEPCGISYDTYMRGGGFLHFLLGSAAVALAVPIYDNIDRIRQGAVGILAGVTTGATIACASAVGLACWLGASQDVLRSIAPKSVTTPIAIGISEEIGGRPPMTVVFVIATGIIGAMLSGRLFGWIGVRDWEARGLAAGIAGHGIATAQILSVNQTAGAFAGLAIGLTALFTAIVLPIAIRFLPVLGLG